MILTGNKNAFEAPPSLEVQFIGLGTEYVKAWNEANVTVKLMRHIEPLDFRKASKKAQLAAVEYLKFNIDIIREMNKSGESPRDTKTFLWRALKKLNFVPPADLMTMIKDEYVVEIYLLDEIQIFRNVRFLEITSFTIEELLCRPWYHLVGRDWRVTLKMFRKTVLFRLGGIKTAVPWGVGAHYMYEKDTPERLEFTVEMKHFIPIRKNGKLVGIVSTNLSTPLVKSTE